MQIFSKFQDSNNMNDLALKIGGTPFPTIKAVQHLSDIGPFGQNFWQVTIQLLIFTAVIVVIFILVWSGIQWITSGGDKQKLQAARSRLTYAIIGIIIIFLSFFIVSIVGIFFNVPLSGNTPNSPAPNRRTPLPTIPDCRVTGACSDM